MPPPPPNNNEFGSAVNISYTLDAASVGRKSLLRIPPWSSPHTIERLELGFCFTC